ncbi:hypothetical protein HNQ41_001130 [Texcoconibacillus texcoconensis]|uniref:Uncharacterized protein n=1 Tax=Texcoconibacillus texcoconensis TaxID=1095777 RepID=A0A840QNP5_9BACI|nr:hypothetical protein [Texcoconibacillus texcoconensis]
MKVQNKKYWIFRKHPFARMKGGIPSWAIASLKVNSA